MGRRHRPSRRAKTRRRGRERAGRPQAPRRSSREPHGEAAPAPGLLARLDRLTADPRLILPLIGVAVIILAFIQRPVGAPSFHAVLWGWSIVNVGVILGLWRHGFRVIRQEVLYLAIAAVGVAVYAYLRIEWVPGDESLRAANELVATTLDFPTQIRGWRPEPGLALTLVGVSLVALQGTAAEIGEAGLKLLEPPRRFLDKRLHMLGLAPNAPGLAMGLSYAAGLIAFAYFMQIVDREYLEPIISDPAGWYGSFSMAASRMARLLLYSWVAFRLYTLLLAVVAGLYVLVGGAVAMIYVARRVLQKSPYGRIAVLWLGSICLAVGAWLLAR